MNEHSIGFAVGFVLALLAVMLIKRLMYSKTGEKTEYDERQKIIQGAAYKYGFFTAIISVTALAILDILDIHLFADDATAMFLVLYLSVGVFAGYSIQKGAFLGWRPANAGRYIRFLIVITVLNVIPGVKNLANGSMITNGRLNYTCLNLFTTVLLVVVLGLLLMQKRQNQDE